MRALAAGRPAPGVVAPHEGPCGPGTVFVYSGQGSQWAGMGRQLLADEPAFAAAVAELEPVFVEQVGFSLQQVLAAGEPVVGIERIQPVLVGMQLALTALWRSYGVEPDAVIGHSMGEVTAAVVAGALSPADGLKVIATRSRLMSRLAGQGAMALLELDAEATEALIADYPEVTVAVYASPRQTVIAGPPEQVDAVIAVVSRRRTGWRGGSRWTWPRIIRIDRSDPARVAHGAGGFDAEQRRRFRCHHHRRPTPAPRRRSMPTTGWPTCATRCGSARPSPPPAPSHATFIEISPHPLLTHAITDTLARHPSPQHRHAAARHRRHADASTPTSTPPTPPSPPQTPHPPEPHPVLPTTPWHHTHHWITGIYGRLPVGAHPLLGIGCHGSHQWHAGVGEPLGPDLLWLGDHCVDDAAFCRARPMPSWRWRR